MWVRGSGDEVRKSARACPPRRLPRAPSPLLPTHTLIPPPHPDRRRRRALSPMPSSSDTADWNATSARPKSKNMMKQR